MHTDMRKEWLLTLALSSLGCATAAPDRRVSGVTVPAALYECAERGAAPQERAEACRALSRKLLDRDPVEALRFLRRGAALRDAECCLEYLAFAESKEISASQRLYARIFLEGLLSQGPVLMPDGRDLTPELLYQLASAWRHGDPRDPDRARQNIEAFLRSGPPAHLARSPAVAQLIRELGARPEAAPGGGASWMRERPTRVDSPALPDWATVEATAWGGGNDRLWQASGVLAFVVNAEGEPSLRGRALWIRNCGRTPVYYTSMAAGRTHRELLPGREELVPLSFSASEFTTGVPVSVRYALPF